MEQSSPDTRKRRKRRGKKAAAKARAVPEHASHRSVFDDKCGAILERMRPMEAPRRIMVTGDMPPKFEFIPELDLFRGLVAKAAKFKTVADLKRSML